jgi:hypothetical protein
MSKMGSHEPFGHFKHKLWPKEEPGVKFAIWLLTTKSQELPRFFCVQVMCDIPLERSRPGLQLFYRPHFNCKFAHNVMAPQSCRSLDFGNFETPLGSPRTKWHLGASPMARHTVYYKGEGGGFPPSPGCDESWESDFARGSS